MIEIIIIKIVVAVVVARSIMDEEDAKDAEEAGRSWRKNQQQ
jgi:hypothetical protein